MKIGIIGSGTVAKSLGEGFIKYGYEVMLGSRDSSKLKEWQNERAKQAQTGSFSEAAQFGDMLVLAVKGKHAEAALKIAGEENLIGKTIIDACNPIDDSNPPEDGVLKFFTGQNESLMEQLQDAFPNVNFVKAFNSIGAHLMVDPHFDEGKPTMFIAGNNEQAKNSASEIIEKFGWEVKDMGTAKAARAIEPLCMLWCIPGFRENQWLQAFKFLTK